MIQDKSLKPDDFPIETEDKELKTNKGEPIASAKSPRIAEDLAKKVNEQADREEQERWA
jgi:hypothetical protein